MLFILSLRLTVHEQEVGVYVDGWYAAVATLQPSPAQQVGGQIPPAPPNVKNCHGG